MYWIVTILSYVAMLFLGYILKDFIPSYMKKKAENLATKEDIKEITKKTEEVQKIFKEEFELFSKDIDFKYDFNYKRYTELYCELYAILCQSEYIRYYLGVSRGQNITTEQLGIIDIPPTLCIDQSGETTYTETSVSKDNSERLYELVNEKAKFATKDLLKSAIAYRFVRETVDPKCINNDALSEEYSKREQEMIYYIVKDYNNLRRDLKMDYDEDEIETGRIKY